MGDDATNDRLLPDKHRQHELFICDVADAMVKDVLQEMEHPFYSLSKSPCTSVREYRYGDHWIRITPGVRGLATIYDKDLLIYAISQLMAKLNTGEEVSPRVRITCRDFLVFANRGTAGKDYDALLAALERLRGTTISTNITTGGTEQTDVFGLIDRAAIRRQHGLKGRLQWVEIVLSDWLFNAIKAKEVLTMSRDYFRLGKPYERRVYEIARKHCGRQKEWSLGLLSLRRKMGARSPMKKFRYFIREMAASDHLPDYRVKLTDGDRVFFFNRQRESATLRNAPGRPLLSPQTYERAKKYTGRECVYDWEAEWIEFWRETGCPTLKSPDRAFLGFCKTRSSRLARPLRAVAG